MDNYFAQSFQCAAVTALCSFLVLYNELDPTCLQVTAAPTQESPRCWSEAALQKTWQCQALTRRNPAMTAQSASLSWVPPKSWNLSLCGVFLQLGLNCSLSPAQVCTHPASTCSEPALPGHVRCSWSCQRGFSLLSPIPTEQIMS